MKSLDEGYKAYLIKGDLMSKNLVNPSLTKRLQYRELFQNLNLTRLNYIQTLFLGQFFKVYILTRMKQTPVKLSS